MRNSKKLWVLLVVFVTFLGACASIHIASRPSEANLEVYDLVGSKLVESPNCENALAAVMAARSMGCSPEGIKSGLESFTPLDHRLSLVGVVNGVEYLDDSKATNVGAVWSALQGMNKPVLLIAGGRDKGGSYTVLHEPLRNKVKRIFLIGEAKEKMAESFEGITAVELVDSLDQAVDKAQSAASPGDVVLLSPACASFDMFTSYAERGNAFKKCVLALSENVN